MQFLANDVPRTSNETSVPLVEKRPSRFSDPRRPAKRAIPNSVRSRLTAPFTLNRPVYGELSETMRSLTLLLVGVTCGVLANTWAATGRGQSPSNAVQGASPRQGRGGGGTVDIAPVPNPPLYPDLQPATKPMHYPAEYMRRIHEIRRAKAGRGIPPIWAPGEPRIDGQLFRTHQLGVSSSGYGLTFRQRYEKPRPSQATGVMSYYDDADQHEGVTDFVIMVGGSGRFVVDGEIENREYGRDPHNYDAKVPPRNTGTQRVPASRRVSRPACQERPRV